MVKKITSYIPYIILLFFIFIFSSSSRAAINPDFTPKWQVGDSWEIVMREMGASIPASFETIEAGGYIERPGDPVYIQFKVVDFKEIEGEMCHIIEVTSKYSTSEYKRNTALQLYVYKDDFTLKKVVVITKRGDGTIGKTEYTNENDHDFTLFRSLFSTLIPCDFPNFPATNIDEERTIQVPDSTRLITQKVYFINNNTAKIELFTKNNNGLLKTVQIWERGKPWWSSCKREFTYKDITRAGLPEVTKVEYDPVLVATDLTPPELNVSVNPTILWPPSHKMVEITPTISVSDNYDRYPDVKLESTTSNEPDDALGLGDGNTTQDIQTTQVWDSKQHKMVDKILLRAERDGNGTGRIYTITYTAEDFSGNKSVASAIVTVPHSQRKEKK